MEDTVERPNMGRTVISGAYGEGEVTDETQNTLTLRLPSGATVTVNKAGNLHYAAKKPE